MQENCYPNFKKQLILFLFPFILVTLFGLTTLTSNDIYWHIASGRYIVTNLEIPRHGIFSYTLKDKPWVDHEWLLQIFLYLFYKVFGFKGLSVLKLVLYLFIYFILYRLARRTCRESIWHYTVFLIFPIMMSTSRLFLRPELFSIILLLLLYYYYHRLKPWHFFVIGMIWANIHAYFILGFVVIGADVLARIIKYRRGIRKSVLNFTAFALGTLINPYFINLHLRTFYEARHPIFLKNIAEWASPFAITYYKVPLSYIFFVVFTGLVVVVIVANTLIKKRIESWREIFLFLLTFALAAKSLRFIPIFGFFMFPIFLKYCAEVIPYLSPHRRLLKGVFIIMIGVYAYLAFLVASNRFFPENYSIVTIGLGLSPKKYSLESVQYLKEVCNDTRIFNTFECGGWLALNAPKIKTFIDASQLDNELFMAYQLMLKHPKMLMRYLDQEKINFAYIPYYTGQHLNLLEYFAISAADKWKLIYLDSSVAIFSRFKDIPFKEAPIPKRSSPGGASKWLSFLHRPHPFDYFNRAVAYSVMNVPEKAFTYYKKSLQINPRDPTTLYNLGYYYYTLNRKEQAKFFYKKALEFQKDFPLALFGLGQYYFGRGDFNKARSYFLKAGNRSRYNVDIYFWIGETYFLQKNLSEAEKWYLKSASSRSYSRLGDIRVINEDFIGAAKMYLRALELNTNARTKKKLEDAVKLIPTFN